MMAVSETIAESRDGGSKKEERKKKVPVSKIVIFVILILYTLFLFVPFYVSLITSLTSREELNSSLSFIWWPENGLTLEAYKYLFTEDPFIYVTGLPSLLLGFLNTMWMTLLTTLIGLFVSGMAAYAYSKLRFKGRKLLFWIEISTMMIPTAALTMPSFLFYEEIGWTGTVLPLIIPGMFGGATTIFFLKTYFDQLSNGFIEAAKIDGLGVFALYVKIMIPLAVPAFVAQFIFAFVGGYNDYMGPLLYLYDDPNKYTLQLALSELRGFSSSNAVMCATAVVALVPLLILYVFMQRLFIDGIAVGGGKE